ncbi:MAG: hypothetical protein ABW171_08445 [Steroidobacter sp.]
MRKRIRISIGVLGALLMVSTMATQAGELASLTSRFPEPAPPPNGEAQWVAQSMRMNGLPMTIKAFKTSADVDEVINFYEHWWRAKGKADYTRSRRDEWSILGIKTDEHYITVQARSTLGGSEGTIAVSADPRTVKRVATRFPHPKSSTVVTLQEYEDFGVQSEHITLLSQRSASTEAREFANMLVRGGWQLVLDRRATKTQGHIIEVQKDAQHAQLSFLPGRDLGATTAVTVVWKKS